MSFFYVVLTVTSVLMVLSEGAFTPGNNPLSGAGDLNAMRPRCAYDRYGNKHVPCPSPDAVNPANWPCVKMADLCNGVGDCPNREDEQYIYCFYHRFRANEISKLRQSVEQMKGR